MVLQLKNNIAKVLNIYSIYCNVVWNNLNVSFLTVVLVHVCLSLYLTWECWCCTEAKLMRHKTIRFHVTWRVIRWEFQICKILNLCRWSTCVSSVLNICFLHFYCCCWQIKCVSFEPQRGKTYNVDSDQCLTQTRLYSHWRWLEAWSFVVRKKRYCTIQVAKTKALIIPRLCFRICKPLVFSWRSSFLLTVSKEAV